MNFFQLYESIKIPPHLPYKWLKEIAEKAKTLESKFINLKNIVKKADKFEQEYGNKEYFINDLWRYLPYELRSEFDYINQLISDRIKEFFDVQDMKDISIKVLTNARDRIDVYDRFNKKNGIVEFMKKYSEIFLKNKYFEELYQVLEDNKDDIENYNETIQVIKETEKGFKAIRDYLILAKEINRNISAFKEREEIISAKYYTGKEILPKHSQYEVLFHATPFVKEILLTGFKEKEEVDREVLGGMTEGISFTADINIAKAIVQALTDVIKIAKGELKIADLIRMFKDENVIKMKGTEWLLSYKQFLQRKKLGLTLHPTYDDPRQRIFKLYQNYLARSKLRYDPLFFGVTIEKFEDLDVSNVGIIAAKIDMSKVKRYLRAMEEFRVQKNAIQGYWKV